MTTLRFNITSSFNRDYDDVIAGCVAAGYYSGPLAWNPFDNAGLQEFRDWEPLGFHFGVTSESA